MSRYIALIPAAGVGQRFGAGYPKQYYPLAGKTVLQHTVQRLLQCQQIEQILLVVSADDQWIREIYPPVALPEKVQILYCGGATRAHTVLNGLRSAQTLLQLADDDWVLVHDAARCCVPVIALQRLIKTVDQHQIGGLLALPVTDTLKCADDKQQAVNTLDRNCLWQAQTPQMFRVGLLRQALTQVDLELVTDDASAVESLGLFPLLVEGDQRNIKLTRAEDALLATFFLQQEQSL